MKNLLVFLFTLLLSALNVSTVNAETQKDAASQKETVTIVADAWCPYNCEPDSALPGFMIEFARAALSKHGIDVKYSTMPWSRAIEEGRQGKHDAIVGAFISDAPDFIYPTLPLGRSETSFFVKSGNPWRYADEASLAQTSVGVIIDYSYGGYMDDYIVRHRDDLSRIQMVSGENALEINLKKLVSGRVGTIMEDADVVAHYISRHEDIKDKIETAGLYSFDDVYIGFSPGKPNSKKYADIMTKELEAMRASGEFQKILTRYGLSDFVEPAPAAVPAETMTTAPASVQDVKTEAKTE